MNSSGFQITRGGFEVFNVLRCGRVDVLGCGGF